MGTFYKGQNCYIGNNVHLGENVSLGHNCIIEDDVEIGEGTYIDSNSIIRSNTSIGANSFIGSNCIVGEYWMDFCVDRQRHEHSLHIGKGALIRSGSIIYTGSDIGNDVHTGHHVTIREKTHIGSHVSIGTLSDIQGNCKISDYVRLHSNVHIGQLSEIESFVWIYPYVVLTNDPTPPSENFAGVHVKAFSVIATAATIMPGLEIGQDSLVAAGAVVTKSVKPFTVVAGTPAKQINDVRNIKNRVTNESVYPWRHHFSNYMPWFNGNFNTWYASLSSEDRQYYNIEFLGEVKEVHPN